MLYWEINFLCWAFHLVYPMCYIVLQDLNITDIFLIVLKYHSSTTNTSVVSTLQPNLHPAKLISGINGVEWINGGTDTDIERENTDAESDDTDIEIENTDMILMIDKQDETSCG